MKRRDALLSGLIHVCTMLKEQPNDWQIPSSRSKNQWCNTILIAQIGIYATLQEQGDNVLIAATYGPVEQRSLCLAKLPF